MAKIKNASPKNSSGGYERVLGNKALADIVQKIQSTVISNGNELEKIIQEMATTIIDDLDAFINSCKHKKANNGTYLCPKRIAKKSKYGVKNKEPDLIIFSLSDDEDICYIIELKDGHVFDTKKVRGEKENLDIYVKSIASEIPFLAQSFICCFNMLDKKQILAGMKNEFKENEVMTGQELCDILGINYETIVNKRREDAKENFEYCVEEICLLVEVRNKVLEQFRKKINYEDFYTYDEEEM